MNILTVTTHPDPRRDWNQVQVQAREMHLVNRTATTYVGQTPTWLAQRITGPC